LLVSSYHLHHILYFLFINKKTNGLQRFGDWQILINIMNIKNILHIWYHDIFSKTKAFSS